jgi:hypothetical protein
MTMPSVEHYNNLISKLRRASKGVKLAEDHKERLACGVGALQAIVLYLTKDEEVIDEELTRPLAIIENAVRDAGQGATVALLEHTPANPGKPRDVTREYVQAVLAFGVELLRASNMSTSNACKWVAEEARKHHVVTEDGSPLTAKRIEGWREDINRRKAPAGAHETFEGLRHEGQYALLLKGSHSAAKRKVCEALARALVKAAAGSMPQAAPNPSHRIKQ